MAEQSRCIRPRRCYRRTPPCLQVRSDAARVIQRTWREHHMRRMRQQQTEGYNVSPFWCRLCWGRLRVRSMHWLDRVPAGANTRGVGPDLCCSRPKTAFTPFHAPTVRAAHPLPTAGPEQRQDHAGHAGAAACRPGAAAPRQPGFLGADAGGWGWGEGDELLACGVFGGVHMRLAGGGAGRPSFPNPRHSTPTNRPLLPCLPLPSLPLLVQVGDNLDVLQDAVESIIGAFLLPARVRRGWAGEPSAAG